jgi:hypothetical protein
MSPAIHVARYVGNKHTKKQRPASAVIDKLMNNAVTFTASKNIVSYKNFAYSNAVMLLGRRTLGVCTGIYPTKSSEYHMKAYWEQRLT